MTMLWLLARFYSWLPFSRLFLEILMNVVLAVIFCALAILLVFKKLIVLTGTKKGRSV